MLTLISWVKKRGKKIENSDIAASFILSHNTLHECLWMWKRTSHLGKGFTNVQTELGQNMTEYEPFGCFKVFSSLKKQNWLDLEKLHIHDSSNNFSAWGRRGGGQHWEPTVAGWALTACCGGRWLMETQAPHYFPLGHSPADKFSSAVFVSAHYCGFAGFIFTYVIFPYPSLHSHSSFGQIMWLKTICFVNLIRMDGDIYLTKMCNCTICSIRDVAS